MYSRLPVCVFSFIAATLALGAERKTLKVKVQEPVLEELMGGCSMRCTFAWTVEVVEGKRSASTKLLNDEKATTAWLAVDMESRPTLRFLFPKRLPREMEGQVPFYGIDLINGHWATEELWRQHGRLRKARFFYNGELLGDASFGDSRRWQKITLPDIMVRSGDVLTMEVLEVYPGTGAGLALTEVVLQGAH